MDILFINWNSYGNEDMVFCLKKLAHKVTPFSFPSDETKKIPLEQATSRLLRQLTDHTFDFVFSFNYFPSISDTCLKASTKYVSWTYDSPFVKIFSHNVGNPHNYVFVFDRTMYLELKALGIDTVYHLPLAANTTRYHNFSITQHIKEKYNADISFVGSLYSEEKNDLYRRLEGISPYTKGFLDGLMNCQKQVYGSLFLQSALSEDIIIDMIHACPVAPSPDSFENVLWIYSNYFLARKITAMERQELITLLSKSYKLHLYTGSHVPDLGNQLFLHDPIDYYMQMPYVFKCSKINLNITLRSIQSGIPLRAMDILGCEGFLLSNYQEEFLDHFVPDKDFVFYEDYNDLLYKADFYLKNDSLRNTIAHNGFLKVQENHTYFHRINSIIEVISS